MSTLARCLGCLLLILCLSCEADTGLRLPGRESDAAALSGFTRIARIVHVTDTHVVDEESPARFPGADELVSSAWRPHEAYSAQILDGILRTANRIHAAGRTIDFLVHTGDACDNAQSNELAWVLDVFDGNALNPLTGPDDRAPADRPAAELDPHAAFTPQGLYRENVHGAAASIAWYATFGNHDRFCIGTFEIVEDAWGNRTAPLPLPERPGLLLPRVLDPVGWLAYGRVTPAEPGPPPLLNPPGFVWPNGERRFHSKREYIDAMFATETGPAGHGFADADRNRSYYSTSPAAGLRLIGLDTCAATNPISGFPYADGAVSAEQVAFLRSELAAAQAAGELVIVASHHPTSAYWEGYGSAVTGSEFRSLLNEYPNVILHLAGHHHRNVVFDREGYLEIETCSTIDLPQEARLIEIWQNPTTGEVAIAYEMFSHLDDTLPALGEDPLRGLREAARQLAEGDVGGAERQKRYDPSGTSPEGTEADCRGVIVLPERRITP